MPKQFPNQPIGFWHDDGSRYHQAYWDKYPGVWHHGDEIEITDKGGVLFFGRSDTVLNPGGVRIGTAEIYQQVNALPEIHDSIAIGRHIDRDEQVILFVQLAQNVPLMTSCSRKSAAYCANAALHAMFLLTFMPSAKSRARNRASWSNWPSNKCVMVTK